MAALARVLAKEKQHYIELAHALLPSTCPRCNAPKSNLILDSEDNEFAYCWSHYGEVFIGKPRSPEKPQHREVGPSIRDRRLQDRSLMS